MLWQLYPLHFSLFAYSLSLLNLLPPASLPASLLGEWWGMKRSAGDTLAASRSSSSPPRPDAWLVGWRAGWGIISLTRPLWCSPGLPSPSHPASPSLASSSPLLPSLHTFISLTFTWLTFLPHLRQPHHHPSQLLQLYCFVHTLSNWWSGVSKGNLSMYRSCWVPNPKWRVLES